MKISINSLDEIIEDICVEGEHLGDIHAIVYHYNKGLSREQLNEATLEVLEIALKKQVIAVGRDTDPENGKFLELQWPIHEIIEFVKREWEKFGRDDISRFYCLWIINKISTSAFKQILAKTAMDKWQYISPGIEKLVYSENSITPGLTFIFRERGSEGKPVIETWKHEKFITRRTFEN